jgi:hypothetical protein
MLAIVRYGEQNCGELWCSILRYFRVVFVIMMISSLAFYIMAFRVPVVSWEKPRQHPGRIPELTRSSKNACSTF